VIATNPAINEHRGQVSSVHGPRRCRVEETSVRDESDFVAEETVVEDRPREAVLKLVK